MIFSAKSIGGSLIDALVDADQRDRRGQLAGQARRADDEVAGALLGDADAERRRRSVAEEERDVGDPSRCLERRGRVCSKKKSPSSVWPAIVSVMPVPPTVSCLAPLRVSTLELERAARA